MPRKLADHREKAFQGDGWIQVRGALPAPEEPVDLEPTQAVVAIAIPVGTLAFILFVLAGCVDPPMPTGRDFTAPDGGAKPPVEPTDPGAPDAATPTPPPPMVDGGVLHVVDSGPAAPRPPGSLCTCDTDCADDGGHQGICVRGVCMTRASAACASSGSSAECPDGSRCWRARDTSVHVCFPDCDSHACAGRCDGDGSCVDAAGFGCDDACGTVCPTPATPPPPPPPPGSDTCPAWECSGTSCTDLIMLPGSSDPDSAEARAAGYFIDTHARYTYLRRDLIRVLQYAACRVAQRFPGTNPIGISDLSQSDGRTPGLDVGDARHPTTTHRGNDLDLAYYQTDGLNDTQIVCGDGSDRNGNGRPGTYNDGYFCTTERNIVDWPRQAFFFAVLAVTPLVRVFGVDTTFVDDFRDHLGALRDAGEIDEATHDRATNLGYGSSGGWQFHHHHSHMSYTRP
jgi:hypothetical protein